jgi:MoaA/NifB/PqqE/SkfB family radical SAM enzyme
LSFDQLRDRIETFVDRGVGQLVYSGGEPLSRFDDLIKLVTYFDDRCDQWIYTSGYGLTFQRANALKEAGLDGIAISLDHHVEERHNQFRGNNKSFFWVLEAIKNCQKAGIMVALNLCPTRDYLEHFDLEHYLQLAKDLQVPIINILEPRAVGNYREKAVELDSSYKDKLLRITHQYNFDKTLIDFPTIVYPAAFRKTLPCGGGRSYLFLDYDGKLYPCSFCKAQVSDISLSKSACLA